MKPDATRQGSPASAMGHHTCWLSGNMKPNEQQDWQFHTASLTSHTRCGGSCYAEQVQAGAGAPQWQAAPRALIALNANSPFPTGRAVCACNSLAVQCPEAAVSWNQQANEDLMWRI